ncbi:GMC oxidoreductase [Rhizoctonia solani]|uniref:GMC oxidoreductase n=1 Tax=Rhizoctonia solani TaxID=456999 RepID=A0A8H7IJ63_9AGAM|nr:GMC oxidoreductase [Rhizoctonia solani]
MTAIHDPPSNQPAYHVDQITLVESVKFADKIAKAKPSATMLVAHQGPSLDIKLDKVITKWVKCDIRTLRQVVGTAAVTPKSLEGVQASVVLMHLVAHVRHAIYGVAERAADVIKSNSGFQLRVISEAFCL